MGVEFRPHRPAAAQPQRIVGLIIRRRVQSAGTPCAYTSLTPYNHISERAERRCLPVMIHAHYEYQILGKASKYRAHTLPDQPQPETLVSRLTQPIIIYLPPSCALPSRSRRRRCCCGLLLFIEIISLTYQRQTPSRLVRCVF